MKKIVFVSMILITLIWASFLQLNRENRDESITIHGEISPYYNYTLRSFYVAQSDLPFCKTGYLYLFGEPTHKGKYFDYKPDINETQHTITIPLNEMSSSICDYRLKRIALTYHFGSSNVLFVNGSTFRYSSNIKAIDVYRTTQLLPILRSQEKSDYTIDFYSHADYNAYYEKLFKEEKKHNMLIRDTRKELKTLHKLIVYPYISKYKKFPKEEILSQSNQLLYVDEKEREKSLEKLQKNITYVNGNPVDEWGNPFVLKRVQAKGKSTFDYVTLFSLGEDGVESKDDISLGINQGLPDPLYDENYQLKKRAMDTVKSINSLSSLLTKFQYKYKKVANLDEAKELFKKDNKYDIHPSKSNLIYLNDEPVDGWGHPFVYDIESDKNYPMLYSVGEDGRRSGDDIKRKMYRLF